MECFSIYYEDIKGRFDPVFYNSIYIENEKQIVSSRWDVKPLSKIATKIVDGPFGSQLKVEEYVDEGIPLIRVKDIKNVELLEDNFVFITKEKQDQLKRSKVFPGDIILTKAGSIGNAAILPKHIEEANITSHVAKIEINDETLSKYLCEYLNTKFAKLQIFRQGNKTTRPELNISEVGSILVILPSSKIQKDIINKMKNAYALKKQKERDSRVLLDSIDDFVLDKLGIKLPENGDKMCYSVNSDALKNNRIDSYYYQPTFKNLESTIEKLNHKTLGEIIQLSKETWNQNDIFEEKFPYIEISQIDIDFGMVKEVTYFEKLNAPSRAKMIVREEDIIVSTTRPHRGAISIIDKSKDGFIASTGFAVLRYLKTDEIEKNFLYIILRTKLCLHQMLRGSSGGNYPAIASDELKKIKIVLPNKDVQNTITDEVKARIEKAELLQQEAQQILEKAKSEVEKIIMGD